MPKYKIADIITEYEPLFDNLKSLSSPFEYSGGRETQLRLALSFDEIVKMKSKMTADTSIGAAEEFACADRFNKAVLRFGGLFLHASAIKYRGGGYLFAADSGGGKSTHSRLWIEAFGEDEVKILNDDKPVIKFENGKAIVYGTPFDGGSGKVCNDNAPLKGIAFLRQAEENSIRRAETKEIIENLYRSTARRLNKDSAALMLEAFDRLIKCTDFYILNCNTEISAARTARDFMVK